MQIHHSSGTVFALNGWSYSSSMDTALDVGMGNYPGSNLGGSCVTNPDWTQAKTANNYTVRSMHIYVGIYSVPTSATTVAPSVDPTDAPVPAPATSLPTPLPAPQPTPWTTPEPSPEPMLQPTPLPTLPCKAWCPGEAENDGWNHVCGLYANCVGCPSCASNEPTSAPIPPPTPLPTPEPSPEPTSEPSLEPMLQPTLLPTQPCKAWCPGEAENDGWNHVCGQYANCVGCLSCASNEPTSAPIPPPTPIPTPEPTSEPSLEPTLQPTPLPTSNPMVRRVRTI